MDYIIEKYGSIENYIDSIGKIGTTERLKKIAYLDLGERSEAAKLALGKRYWRRELIDKGISFKHAVLIVNRDYCG